MTAPDAEPASGAALTRTVTIVNRRGLHARAAARFVKTAERFKAEITVARKDAVVSGLSIMGLMMLAAASGTSIIVEATGKEAAEVLEALTALINARFGEDD